MHLNLAIDIITISRLPYAVIVGPAIIPFARKLLLIVDRTSEIKEAALKIELVPLLVIFIVLLLFLFACSLFTYSSQQSSNLFKTFL